MVESAKSDKKSLTWIKSLVESTNIDDKADIVGKINEYTDMLTGDDVTNPPVSGSERAAYEATIEQLRDDIKALSQLIVDKDASNINESVNKSDEDTTLQAINELKDKIDNIPKVDTDSNTNAILESIEGANLILISRIFFYFF